MEHKFSIITPTHNRVDSLRRAIQSVMNQTYQNWEMFVCSDGYSEIDENCVKEFNDKRIQYHSIEKPPFKNWGNIQRNEMVKKCTGDYTIWLDDDNDIFPDYLSYANDIVEEGCGVLIFKINHNRHGILPVRNIISHANIDTLNFMIKTEIANKFEWIVDLYAADSHFIRTVESYCNSNNIKINFYDKVIGNHN